MSNLMTFWSKDDLTEFDAWLAESIDKYSRVVVLADEHTSSLCVPRVAAELAHLPPFQIIEIPVGEDSKSWEMIGQLLMAMGELEVDRKSLLIGIGGGVVTDITGFVASVFQRGIDFILIPSSLLAMTDAAIGGKTGVDVMSVKNLAGTFNWPQVLVIWPALLETLPHEEFKNGRAESLKHALIRDADLWKELTIGRREMDADIIRRSAAIKRSIVNEDAQEAGIRKLLNFGHTVGHALESLYLDYRKSNWPHGRCVAAGMCVAAWLSHELLDLPKVQALEIVQFLKEEYALSELQSKSLDELLPWLRFDKKNHNGEWRFVLLRQIGQAEYDIPVTHEQLARAWQLSFAND